MAPESTFKYCCLYWQVNILNQWNYRGHQNLLILLEHNMCYNPFYYIFFKNTYDFSYIFPNHSKDNAESNCIRNQANKIFVQISVSKYFKLLPSSNHTIGINLTC